MLKGMTHISLRYSIKKTKVQYSPVVRVNFFVHPSIHLSSIQSICHSSICLSVHLSIICLPSFYSSSHSFIHKSIHPSMHPTLYSSIHLSIHQSISLFVHSSIHPSIHHLSICLFICRSFNHSITFYLFFKQSFVMSTYYIIHIISF